jgi:pyruvate, water dikinase
MATRQSNAAILWLEALGIGDVPTVGGKNASLGELVRQLGKAGVRVPAGFATTAQAFRDFVNVNAIEPAMREHIERYRSGQETLQDAGHAIRELIMPSAS